MESKAKTFAENAHQGQQRKFSGQPYWYHPVRVAHTVQEHGGSEEAVVAAYVHDTVEDTASVSLSDIEEQFGGKVASIVLELTNDDAQIEEIGKTEYMKHKLGGMTDEALLVKLADRLDNTSDLEDIDSGFASRYAQQTREVVNHLESVRTLYGAHRRILNQIKSNIKEV